MLLIKSFLIRLPCLPAEMVGLLLATDSRYSGNTDDRIHMGNSGIGTAQTWKKLDVPYFMPGTSSYAIGAPLTLEPGVSLTFNSGSGLTVGEAGSLSAAETLEEPIIFTGLEKTPGYWNGILFYYSNSTNNQLDHVIVEYGGAGDSSSSANIASSCRASYPTRFSVTNSTIKDSVGWGIHKALNEDNGCLITQTGNTFNNKASGDVNVP